MTGCTCDLAGPDAGASRRLQLGMYTRSSIESGGHKRFGVAWAFDIDGAGFALPHYDELRETIAPPKTVEGDTSLGVACGDDVVVVSFHRTATAWSVATREELWTVELPASRGEPKTTLGGGATISCSFGRIDRARGRVELPTTSGGTFALALGDGSPLSDRADNANHANRDGGPAGRPKPRP